MLHRQEEDGLVIVSQPAHAWVAGQLARNWGNSEFAPLSEEVCLAAEQHDIGFVDWERKPTLNPATGLPYSFLEMPTAEHLALWKCGIQRMLRFSRYPALLVSRHFYALGERMAPERAEPDAVRIRAFLKNQHALQTTLITSLRNDFHYGDECEDAKVRDDQEIVSLLDWFSLQLLLRFREERLGRFPARNGAGRFQLVPTGASASEVQVKPWPFRPDTVSLICDGRKLLKRFESESEMRRALRAAAPHTIAIRLIR